MLLPHIGPRYTLSDLYEVAILQILLKKVVFVYFSWTSHSKIARIALARCIRYLGTPSREETGSPEHGAQKKLIELYKHEENNYKQQAQKGMCSF